MILFIFAHPDDEAYGPAGTIARLTKTSDVTVVSLCNGERPHSTHVAMERKQAFIDSCNTLGASHEIYDTPDCALEYDSTLLTIENLIKKYNPSAIYTHSNTDIHKDHRLVAECCLVAARPKADSLLDQLYFCEMPASTSWSFNQINGSFQASKYVEVDIEIKKHVLGYYTSEIYEFPDARSIEAVETLAKQRGYQSGFKHAEAFQLVFSRYRMFGGSQY